MKKFYIIFFLLLGTLNFVKAQKAKTTEFGFDIGYSNSRIQSNTSAFSQSGTVIGFNLGFSAEYYFSESWGIKGKAIYDQKGWSTRNILSFFDVQNVNVALNYITVPVMANWHFGHKKNWYLNFGLYDGVLLSADANGDDIKSSYNSNDFGMAYGIGTQIKISKKSAFFIELDAQNGFTGIASNPNDSFATNERGALNIGIAF